MCIDTYKQVCISFFSLCVQISNNGFRGERLFLERERESPVVEREEEGFEVRAVVYYKGGKRRESEGGFRERGVENYTLFSNGGTEVDVFSKSASKFSSRKESGPHLPLHLSFSLSPSVCLYVFCFFLYGVI